MKFYRFFLLLTFFLIFNSFAFGKEVSLKKGWNIFLDSSVFKEKSMKNIFDSSEKIEFIILKKMNNKVLFLRKKSKRLEDYYFCDEDKILLIKLKDKTNLEFYPNKEFKYLRGNFTDTDGDGMTDVAEIKYGFNPNGQNSFPKEPEIIESGILIEKSEIDAKYEINSTGINIKWNNPSDGTYSLELYNGSNQIYYGGHYDESAPVNYAEFNLQGDEILTGNFTKYNLDNQWVKDYPEFKINLSKIIKPKVGNENNKISYTFKNFSLEEEKIYRDFLKKLWPLMYKNLGPPAESFNCEITKDENDNDYFMVVNNGRTFLTDGDFIPRLITHEFIHAWKGSYTFSSDQNWEYNESLSGFEEATAEGMAFEIMHEYVRSYPKDYATKKLLDYKPYQYWNNGSTFYDSIRFTPWTGGGDLWTHAGGQKNRYSIVATTFQIMNKEKPDFYRKLMQKYYEKINNNPNWRPNRNDILNLWTEVVPKINGIETEKYINAIPVFQGHKLDEGIYVLNTIRPYGNIGDQQFAISYAIEDGRLEWGIHEDKINYYDLPNWIKYDYGNDNYFYIDTQNQPFTVKVYNMNKKKIHDKTYYTEYERYSDGTADGFGWKEVKDLAMENFPLGLYREEVIFDNYIKHDSGSREIFYFFGYQDFSQDKNSEYVIMIGLDGINEGRIEIEIEGKSYEEKIQNGVAIFRSNTWPFDLEGKFPIKITNNKNGVSHTYYRTIIEAGTLHNYFQYQFIIIDKDFNGVEDIYEK